MSVVCRSWAQCRMFVFSRSFRWRLCYSCSEVGLLFAALCLYLNITLYLEFMHVKQVARCTGLCNTARCNDDIYVRCPVSLASRTFRHFSEDLVANLRPVNKIAEQIFVDNTGDVWQKTAEIIVAVLRSVTWDVAGFKWLTRQHPRIGGSLCFQNLP